MVDEVIPPLLESNMNNFLTRIPSPKETMMVFFNLKQDSSRLPDGFAGIFYNTYWNIIQKNVINATLEFFKNGWILPKHNSNTLVLLSKTKDANTMEKFIPIALANFKFTVITKIIADRLTTFIPTLVSLEK